MYGYIFLLFKVSLKDFNEALLRYIDSYYDSHGIKDEKPRINLVRGQERVVPNSGIIPCTSPWSFVDVPILIHLKKCMLTFDEGHFFPLTVDEIIEGLREDEHACDLIPKSTLILRYEQLHF